MNNVKTTSYLYFTGEELDSIKNGTTMVQVYENFPIPDMIIEVINPTKDFVNRVKNIDTNHAVFDIPYRDETYYIVMPLTDYLDDSVKLHGILQK